MLKHIVTLLVVGSVAVGSGVLAGSTSASAQTVPTTNVSNTDAPIYTDGGNYTACAKGVAIVKNTSTINQAFMVGKKFPGCNTLDVAVQPSSRLGHVGAVFVGKCFHAIITQGNLATGGIWEWDGPFWFVPTKAGKVYKVSVSGTIC